MVAVGGWRVAVGGWRLAVGGWRLAVGGWQLAVGGWGKIWGSKCWAGVPGLLRHVYCDAVGGGHCRLQMSLRLALGAWGTVVGHRLGARERGGYLPPFRCIPAPLCDIPSGCCFFTGPWTVTRSSLRMLRRVAIFCRPLRPVLLLVSFPRSRSPVVGVPGLC